MPTAHSIETVFNAALDIVGERPILSLTENRKEVRWLVRNYSAYVQTSLRQDVWNFAIELHELNQTTAPAFRWKYAYDLPNGWLRVLPLNVGGDPGGAIIKHAVMSNKIQTNQNNPLYAALIMDRQNPGEWDPLFANVVIARLAQGLAHALTHKASYVQIAKQMAEEAYEQAQLVNAFEGTPGETEQHDIIRVRYQ